MLKGITIGCGFFGNIHLQDWTRVQGARIVAVVDQDAEKARRAAQQHGLAAYTDLATAITTEKPAFVDIATGPGSHLPLAQVAAAHGCHVLCQKPIAPTWDESVALVQTCQEAGVRLMINENWRWQPWYRQIKELIQADAVGPVTTLTFTRREAEALGNPPFPRQPYFVDMPRFLLIESVIHLLDVTRFLGGAIKEVFCDARRVSGVTRGEDSVHLHLVLAGERRGVIYSTRAAEPDAPDPVCDYARVEGQRGFIRLDRDGALTVKPLFEPAFRREYQIPTAGYRGDSVRAALQHFADCLLSGAQFETEGQDYLKHVMRPVFAGYESAQTRQSIKL
jgi:predicted dehydrogenase